MLFLIAQTKRFGTLNATQKTAALYKAPLLKKSGIFRKKSNQGAKRNKKIGGRSNVNTFGVFFFKKWDTILQMAGLYCMLHIYS